MCVHCAAVYGKLPLAKDFKTPVKVHAVGLKSVSDLKIDMKKIKKKVKEERKREEKTQTDRQTNRHKRKRK